MGDRKVINKYIPPDFDPSQLRRPRKGEKRKRDADVKSRMMLPITVRCKTCGGYIYKGTKFNSRKETVKGEDYLGIKIFRFYFRCPACAAEITIKTDPKNSGYTVELGATRNFEPRKAAKEEEDAERLLREEEEEGDKMKALENKTKASKREMDVMDALEDMTYLRARQEAAGGAGAALRALHARGGDAKAAEEGEECAGAGKPGVADGAALAAEADAQLQALEAPGGEGFVRRLAEQGGGGEESASERLGLGGLGAAGGFAPAITAGFGSSGSKPTAGKAGPRFAVRAKPAAKPAVEPAAKPALAVPSAALGALGGYGSSSDDDSD